MPLTPAPQDPLAHPERVVRMVSQGAQESQEPRVSLETLLPSPCPPMAGAATAPEDPADHQDPAVPLEPQGHLGSPAARDPMETPAAEDRRDHPDSQETLDAMETPAPRVPRETTEPREPRDQWGQKDPRENGDPKDPQDAREPMETVERTGPKDHPVSQDPRDHPETQGVMDSQVSRAHPGRMPSTAPAQGRPPLLQPLQSRLRPTKLGELGTERIARGDENNIEVCALIIFCISCTYNNKIVVV